MKVETYKGSKGNSGLYQAIINLMPKHEIYIELFCGKGEIFKRKKRAEFNILVDKAEEVAEYWEKIIDSEFRSGNSNTMFMKFDIVQEMFSGRKPFWTNWSGINPNNTVVFIDPPYPFDTRLDKRKLYRNEMSDSDHIRLLTKIKRTAFPTIITTYPNKIYEERLTSENGWLWIDVKVRTRKRTVTERIYFNFPAPHILHDYRYAGKNYRERERIKSRISRELDKLKRVHRKNPTEYHAIINAIKEQHESGQYC